jgi:hypothetical protein
MQTKAHQVSQRLLSLSGFKSSKGEKMIRLENAIKYIKSTNISANVYDASSKA